MSQLWSNHFPLSNCNFIMRLNKAYFPSVKSVIIDACHAATCDTNVGHDPRSVDTKMSCDNTDDTSETCDDHIRDDCDQTVKNNKDVRNNKFVFNLWWTVFISIFVVTLGNIIVILKIIFIVMFRNKTLQGDGSSACLLG